MTSNRNVHCFLDVRIWTSACDAYCEASRVLRQLLAHLWRSDPLQYTHPNHSSSSSLCRRGGGKDGRSSV